MELRPPTEVAIALLIQNHQFLLQLRDDIPGILYPGYWAFFGGHLEAGETPEDGIRRELQEEIGYCPPWLRRFQRWQEDTVIRTVFYGPLTVPVEQLVLNEGWDLGLWTVTEIQRGERYSAIADQVRPLGAVHRQILLSFLATHDIPLQEPPTATPPLPGC